MPMDKRFNTFMEQILGHEGGYVNHPNDPGGETNWGITLNTARANGYKGSMRYMNRDQALEIYESAFWKAYKIDQFSDVVAFNMLDASINHGYKNAVKFLQRAVRVKDDGIIGSNTLMALKNYSDDALIIRFNSARLKFYTSLKTWSSFGKGWTNRVADNMEYQS